MHTQFDLLGESLTNQRTNCGAKISSDRTHSSTAVITVMMMENVSHRRRASQPEPVNRDESDRGQPIQCS